MGVIITIIGIPLVMWLAGRLYEHFSEKWERYRNGIGSEPREFEMAKAFYDRGDEKGYVEFLYAVYDLHSDEYVKDFFRRWHWVAKKKYERGVTLSDDWEYQLGRWKHEYMVRKGFIKHEDTAHCFREFRLLAVGVAVPWGDAMSAENVPRTPWEKEPARVMTTEELEKEIDTHPTADRQDKNRFRRNLGLEEKF